MNLDEAALEAHKKNRGKIEIRSKMKLEDSKDLSLAYTPGVAAVSRAIAADKKMTWEYTIKRNTIAVVTDGSAVLGLGNIGPEAALPVMEGKAMLFKELGGIDAFPICLGTQEPSEIIKIVRNISPIFAGINLEDIKAPGCFEIENGLQDLGIPVMHDDQHATSIVIQAALQNAARLVSKKIEELDVVISGAGAAGIATARMLNCMNLSGNVCTAVNDITLVDSKGIIHSGRNDLNIFKEEMARLTNRRNKRGGLAEAIEGADVFIGLSVANSVTGEMVKSMKEQPIIFAMANPVPEIMPDVALEAGAAIVGTGRSDFPNQINNVLAFPGVFRGALDAKATRISSEMKIAASHALAKAVNPKRDKILPLVLEKKYVKEVARAVEREARNSGNPRE